MKHSLKTWSTLLKLVNIMHKGFAKRKINRSVWDDVAVNVNYSNGPIFQRLCPLLDLLSNAIHHVYAF